MPPDLIRLLWEQSKLYVKEPTDATPLRRCAGRLLFCTRHAPSLPASVASSPHNPVGMVGINKSSAREELFNVTLN